MTTAQINQTVINIHMDSVRQATSGLATIYKISTDTEEGVMWVFKGKAKISGITGLESIHAKEVAAALNGVVPELTA